MQALKDNGYQGISLDDFYQFKLGKKKLSDKSVLITFDDGRKDSYYPVDPILKTLGFKATMFVITRYVERTENEFYLSKQELIKAIDSGTWDVQAHTYMGHGMVPVDKNGTKGHFFTNKAVLSSDGDRLETDDEYKKRISNDLNKAKENITKDLNRNAYAFAVPFGDIGQETINMPVKNKILDQELRDKFKLVFYQTISAKGNTYTYPNDDPVVLRMDVNPNWSGKALLKNLSYGRDKELPYQAANLSKDNGWIFAWGNIIPGSDGTIMSTGKALDSAQAYLDGTGSWKDYLFKSEIEWKSGKTLTLLARYANNTNYIGIAINRNRVRVHQTVNGKTKVLDETGFKVEGDTIKPELYVVGDKICLKLNGRKISSCQFSASDLPNGGVGVKVWDEAIGAAKIKVKNVNVSEASGSDMKDFEISGNANLAAEPVFWSREYGNLEYRANGLSLAAPKSSNGAMAILKGIKDKSDYTVTADIAFKQGRDISTVFRYKDDRNFAFLTVSNGEIQIGQNVEGKRTILKAAPLNREGPKGNYAIKVELKGKSVIADINRTKFSTVLGDSLDVGTAGFEVWNRMPGRAEIAVKKVNLNVDRN
jgi:peptidoglycan/xylan/chitin deacetylase (PgdA/CDA1 family)